MLGFSVKLMLFVMKQTKQTQRTHFHHWSCNPKVVADSLPDAVTQKPQVGHCLIWPASSEDLGNRLDDSPSQG